MTNADMNQDNQFTAERLALILLGAISGVLSIAILTGDIQSDQWMSPILGIISILLFIGSGLIETEKGIQDRERETI